MANNFKDTTEQVVTDFIEFKLGRNVEAPSSLTAKILRRLAAELDNQHRELFLNMLNALDTDGNSKQSFDAMYIRIAENIFVDKNINWGRIAVLFNFSGHMAVYCERQGREGESRRVAHLLASYVNSGLSSWITKQGGWEAFNEYFKEKEDESDMWWGNVLCTVGLVAGAAGAALVFAR